MQQTLTVKPIQLQWIEPLVNYWVNLSNDQLTAMGADPNKLPSSEAFTKMLEAQIACPINEKPSYATIWLLNGEAIGHCNVNKIEYGKDAFMHLHSWYPENRKKGMGFELVKKSIQLFFEDLKLQSLYCEPYALNPAPNKILPKFGFDFEKRYTTIPGAINFEQEVNRYSLSRYNFNELSKK